MFTLCPSLQIKTKLQISSSGQKSVTRKTLGQLTKIKRLQKSKSTSFQSITGRERKSSSSFNLKTPGHYLMVLIWVTCQPQEQSLWAKRARLLSEKGGGRSKTLASGRILILIPKKRSFETSCNLWECPSFLKITKKVIKLMKLRDVPFACQMEKWKSTVSKGTTGRISCLFLPQVGVKECNGLLEWLVCDLDIFFFFKLDSRQPIDLVRSRDWY